MASKSADDAAVSEIALPLVDYALPRDDIADQVRVALRDYGFMMLKNTEMMEQIAELRAASMEFFKLDEDDEQKIRSLGKKGTVRGYFRQQSLNTYEIFGKEGPPDFCAQMFMGDPGTGNVFPQEEYEAKMTAVYDGFAAIARRLTKIVVEIYGLPPTWVEDEFQAPTLTSFKVLYYPPPPEGECSGLRMAPHFDYDTLTVLYQDPGVPGGLQVNLHGEWQDVVAPPDTLCINVGEVLKFISGGKIKCTEHRVVMPKPSDRVRSERMSMALFAAPKASTVITPHGAQASVTGALQSDDVKEITVGEWFQAAVGSFTANA
eukprot:m.416272 g.416272  ORF g.416272 m.416272 type:complete len:319 (+) comp29901_c0_seq1:57-1013(+)